MRTTNPFTAGLDRFSTIHYEPATNHPETIPPETVVNRLDRLALNRNGIQNLEAQREALVEASLVGIRSVLDAIDTAITGLRSTASGIENEVKEAVLTNGTSVKGISLHAVFSRGRVSYDAKGLDALAVVVPEVLNFRKEGEPSVSIREVKH